MIGPGQLPRASDWRARGLRRPTLAYTRMRKRSISPRAKRATKISSAETSAVNTEIVLFDHGPAEFPVATLRPRELRARAIALVNDLQQWFGARWQWFKPRSVPCAVAGLGMLAVIASADYLAHHQGQQDKAHVCSVKVTLAP